MDPRTRAALDWLLDSHEPAVRLQGVRSVLGDVGEPVAELAEILADLRMSGDGASGARSVSAACSRFSAPPSSAVVNAASR